MLPTCPCVSVGSAASAVWVSLPAAPWGSVMSATVVYGTSARSSKAISSFTVTAACIPCALLTVSVLTPSTYPFSSTKGPPELPLLIAADVWISSPPAAEFSAVTFRTRNLRGFQGRPCLVCHKIIRGSRETQGKDPAFLAHSSRVKRM